MHGASAVEPTGSDRQRQWDCGQAHRSEGCKGARPDMIDEVPGRRRRRIAAKLAARIVAPAIVACSDGQSGESLRSVSEVATPCTYSDVNAAFRRCFLGAAPRRHMRSVRRLPVAPPSRRFTLRSANSWARRVCCRVGGIHRAPGWHAALEAREHGDFSAHSEIEETRASRRARIARGPESSRGYSRMSVCHVLPCNVG